MTTVHAAWDDLAAKFEALGLKLKLHYEQTRDQEVTAAVDRLRQGIEDAFEAAGNAVQDEAVREDVREVGRLLTQALGVTLEKVGQDVRGAASRTS
jgi:hypothetical protein